MKTMNSLSGLAFAVLIAVTAKSNAEAPAQVAESSGKSTAKPAWLAGSGEGLKIRLVGEVQDETGAPENDCKVRVIQRTQTGRKRLPVVMERNRFEAWVPVRDVGWFSLHVDAVSADGQRAARQAMAAFQLRQTAIDGLKITLRVPERTVNVNVIEDGNPVPGGHVVADVAGEKINARTNDEGVASIPLFRLDSLAQLTAWTDDFRIGGFSFHRKPPRDPRGKEFTIELERCRSQLIRFVQDTDNSPVPNLDFLLQVGTGGPDYQFVGEIPASEMRSNAQGEAVFQWFPPWKQHGAYVDLHNSLWIKEGSEETVDGALVVKVRKRPLDNRKRVVGQVSSSAGDVAGFLIDLQSFQGEQEHHSDMLQVFTDENGRFEADYLKGATYCIALNDARYVSDVIDLIPCPLDGEGTNAPALANMVGEPIEIVVTAGPSKIPVPHQWIHLDTPHQYSWIEKGETRHGLGSRRWSATTDERGIARSFALPGHPVKAAIYETDWSTEKSAKVKPGGETRLELHRPVAESRTITGRLRLAAGVVADLSEAIVEIASIDGETQERLTLTASVRGEFQFESTASRIGIYARTKDSKAAAVARLDQPEGPIDLTLKATQDFHGQLLGVDERPIVGQKVQASVIVSGKQQSSSRWSTSFSAETAEAKTDDEGNYTLSGLPSEVTIRLNSDSTSFSGQVYLVPDEPRPRSVSRLHRPERRMSFEERYQRMLRDGRLSNFGGMVILFRPAKDLKEFVKSNVLDYDKTREVMAFIQLQGELSDEASGLEVAEFARSMKWPLPDEGTIFALALDASGHEAGRLEVDIKTPEAPNRVIDFIRRHAPPPFDAKAKWDEAFEAARQSDRKVWARIGNNYCGPCFALTRWLDDQKELLERDYVFLKIDGARDLNASEVADRLEGHEGQGVPFHAIFDAEGRILITSEAPLGNLGYPSGFEGKQHTRRMLRETRKRLTDAQIDEIVGSLSD